MNRESSSQFKEKIKVFFNNNFTSVYIGILILLSLGIFQKVSIKFLFIIFILQTLYFLIGKDLVEENDRVKGIKFFKFSIFLTGLSFTTIIVRGLSSISKSNKPIFSVAIMLYIGVGTLVLFLLFEESNKEKMEELFDSDIATQLGLFTIEETMKEGDLKVCTNKQTKKSVLSPLMDRFLHYLILGPTGSGKTSQALLPFILQDMKNKNCGFTILEPKGDLAEQVYGMGKVLGREVIYFNPTYPDCPYFNPLYGPEGEVIENIVTVFSTLADSDKQFFADKSEELTRNGIMLIKRLYGNSATLLHFSTLINNINNQGIKMVKDFEVLPTKNAEMAKQNEDLASWFINEYFGNTKEYEHYSGLRSQVAKTVSNEHLRRVLNPPEGRNDLDFDQILSEGKVLAISTSQGELRDMSRYLGYFIILNYQSAVFRRPELEKDRTPHFLYIDEFQEYANPSFGDMLQQGRSYRVGSILATQARAQMAIGKGQEGEMFLQTVSANARNVILFPGLAYADVKYYSDEFGADMQKVYSKTSSEQKFSIFTPRNSSGTESTSERTEEVLRYRPTELRYKKFFELTYSLMNKGTITEAGDGMVDFIPYDLHLKIGEIAAAYREQQLEKAKNLKMDDKGLGESNSSNVAIDPILKIMNENEEDKRIIGDFDFEAEVVKKGKPTEDDLI